MPLQSDSALLPQQQQKGAHHSSKGSFDQDGPAEPYIVDDDVAPPSGCRGVCAGLIEVCSLMCTVPGYWRLAFVASTNTIGSVVGASYSSTFRQQVLGTHAASWGSWLSAISFTFAMIGAPLFGTWSDGRPRKVSVLVFTLASILPQAVLALKIFRPQMENDAFDKGLFAALTITGFLTAPFVAQASGAPALWAWMADTIPQPQREAGFAMVFAIASFAAFVSTIIVHWAVTFFDIQPYAQTFIALAILLLQLLVVCLMPSTPKIEANADDEDPDPLSRQTGCMNLILSPIRLVARKRSLRIICGMAAFVTLPDVAVMNTAFNLISPYVPGVLTDGVASTNFINWFLQFPQGLLVIIYVSVGVCAKRFGPARFLVVWIPLNCLFFCGPVILTFKEGPPWDTLAGVLLLTPVSIFAPLQALVALLVPAHRVGEAMGAVAAFKNLASLIAPVIMGVATSAMPCAVPTKEDPTPATRADCSYWILFPVMSVVMFIGAWPFALMLAKRVNTDTDVEWSVWSSVGGGSVRGSTRGSTRGSARRRRP